MVAGNNNDAPQQKFDKHEQVNFKQAENGAHEAFIGQLARGGAASNDATQIEARFGFQKDGQFKFASAEDIKNMDTKTLQAYVTAHDDYTKQQVQQHPERLASITASYGARLDDDTAKQTYAQVHAFYGNLTEAIG